MEQMDAKTFEGHLAGIVCAGFVSTSIGLGAELGLFDILCSFNEPVTSSAIAQKGNMQERYVREWLGTMVSAKILIQEKEEDTYYLPGQYRDKLGPTWLATVVPCMGERHQRLKECFMAKEMKGIEWDAHVSNMLSNLRIKTFTDEVVIAMVEHVPGIQERLESGITVADIGCGAGRLVNILARMFPKSTFIGVDSSTAAIEAAEKLSKSENNVNISYYSHDATSLPAEWTDKFDFVIVYDVIHDLPHPTRTLGELRRILKSSGYFSVVETDIEPKPSDSYGDMVAASYFARSNYICIPSSACGGGTELFGACWGKEMAATILRSSGFNIVTKSEIPLKYHIHFVCQKSP